MAFTAGLTTLDDAADSYPWNDVYYNDDLATGANDGSSEANAWQTLAAMAAGVRGGDRVNMKATGSPVVLTGAFTFPPGDNLGPIWYRGYTSTPGDLGKWNGDASTFNFASDVGPQIFSDLGFDGSGTSYVFLNNGHDQTWFYRCAFTSDAQGECLFADQCALIACTFNNSGTFSVSGYEAATGKFKAVGCKFQATGNAVQVLTSNDEGAYIFKSSFFADGGNGEACQFVPAHFESGGLALMECSLHADALNTSLTITTSFNASWEGSGIWANNVAYGDDIHWETLSTTEDSFVLLLNYSGGAVTSDYSGWGNFEDIVYKPTALSADPFTSKGTGDFSLNATAGGGASCRDAVDIGYLAGAASEKFTSACDAGAVRHGTDDGGDPDSLVGSSQAAGAGLSGRDFGLLPVNKTSEIG